MCIVIKKNFNNQLKIGKKKKVHYKELKRHHLQAGIDQRLGKQLFWPRLTCSQSPQHIENTKYKRASDTPFVKESVPSFPTPLSDKTFALLTDGYEIQKWLVQPLNQATFFTTSCSTFSFVTHLHTMKEGRRGGSNTPPAARGHNSKTQEHSNRKCLLGFSLGKSSPKHQHPPNSTFAPTLPYKCIVKHLSFFRLFITRKKRLNKNVCIQLLRQESPEGISNSPT